MRRILRVPALLSSRLTRNFVLLLALLFVLTNLWVAQEIAQYEQQFDLFTTQTQSLKNLFQGSNIQNQTQSETNVKATERSDSFGNQASTLEIPSSSRVVTKKNVCSGYKGVLHIAMGDIGGAAGTIFFQFVIGQLIYAEAHRLIPLIYFNNVSNVIYDEAVHGTGPGLTLTFKGVGEAVDVVRPNGHWRDRTPGPPNFTNLTEYQTYHFSGTGVWDQYFLPVSPSLVPTDQTCRELPYMTLTLKQITPGIHGFVPWAPRCWRYHYLPDYVTKPHIPIHEWLRPSRILGHKAVERYKIRFQPHLIQAARKANPHCATPENSLHCLGLHIRHSDKAAGRRVVQVSEFLPYAQAFVNAGGKYIYLATDSTLVLKEIADTWPLDIRNRIHSLGDGGDEDNSVVRSSGEEAVFDIGSHHRTNTEVLVEIMALSMCRFMVHGLSAVSESTLWLNDKLQSTSVDLEDPNHFRPGTFGTLVQMVLRGEEDPNYLPKIPQSTKWWKTRSVTSAFGEPPVADGACVGYKGILHISSSGGDQISVGTAFFSNVLNQIIYAAKFDLIPWVHLMPSKVENSVLYDRWAHGYKNDETVYFRGQSAIANSGEYPGAPQELSANENDATRSIQVTGNGIWDSYFEPVSNFHPGDKSCTGLHMSSMSDYQVKSLTSHAPWTVRAWIYNTVPEDLQKQDAVSWKEWFAPIRKKAHEIVTKHYRFRPYLKDRAASVNPVEPHQVCLAVHMRNGDKKGKTRSKVPAKDFLPYLEEFAKAGGDHIYIASDSQRTINFILQNSNLTEMIRIQGEEVVRTTKEWPLHMIDNHHRVNGEALVDILAMSKCQFLLHTFSTIAEAAIYVNIGLHDNSVNLEDPNRLSISDFSTLVKRLVDNERRKGEEDKQTMPASESSTKEPIAHRKLLNTSMIFRDTARKCKHNALVYLAQKKHSSYIGRDSYANLIRSLDLVNKNYLSIGNHLENLDIFIFHTDDFTEEDLVTLEQRLGESFKGAINLVNLSGSPFWQRPPHQANDDPSSWYAYPLFSEGYRRMMHWFAIDIWDFFSGLNDQLDCSYRYIFRLDEDSYIHSPIQYDLFEFMKTNQYSYGYRLCTYEMQVTRRMWTMYTNRNTNFQPERNVNLEMCGFYNNFFVADLEFFTSPAVQKFLRFIDRQGHIYRRRLGDLMIHSMSVYAFAPTSRIHRFLDFTYEHGTVNETTGCLIWGGIQAGYDDRNATITMSDFYEQNLVGRNCVANATQMRAQDLSPSYAHLPSNMKESLALSTITAGRVEFPLGKGILSG